MRKHGFALYGDILKNFLTLKNRKPSILVNEENEMN